MSSKRHRESLLSDSPAARLATTDAPHFELNAEQNSLPVESIPERSQTR